MKPRRTGLLRFTAAVTAGLVVGIVAGERVATTRVAVAARAVPEADTRPSATPPILAGATPPARLLPGELLRDHGVGIVVPPPGTGVWGEILKPNAEAESLGIETAADGTTVIRAWGEDAVTGMAASSPGACADVAFTSLPWRWAAPLSWYFRAGTTPTGVTRLDAEDALRRATRNVARGYNDCGVTSGVLLSATYLGRTSRAAQFGTDGSCRDKGDGYNVVAFGDLPSGVLGIACVWYDPTTGLASESDVVLNKGDFRWTVTTGSACRNRWSIQAVATHERGHTFGLGHVPELYDANLTMSTSVNGPCQSSESTLGLGDVKALQAKYALK